MHKTVDFAVVLSSFQHNIGWYLKTGHDPAISILRSLCFIIITDTINIGSLNAVY